MMSIIYLDKLYFWNKRRESKTVSLQEYLWQNISLKIRTSNWEEDVHLKFILNKDKKKEYQVLYKDKTWKNKTYSWCLYSF